MPPLAPVAHAAGSAWSLQSTALPSVSQGSLFADACSSPTSCIAVGTFEDGSGTQVALAEKWNGTTWSVQSAPSPAGATDSELHGISCSSATSCIAVGFSGAQALAEQWNGTTWAILPTPTPAGGSALEGVSCSAPGDCTAVGTRGSRIGGVTLAESWNGTSWTIETTVNPRGAPAPHYDSVLGSVSCTSATACTAAGWFTKTVKNDVTLAEVWNGTAWTVQATPDPARAIVTKLTGVSCSSVTACIAVGSSFSRASDSDVTLAERWNGTTWKLQSTPNPAGAVASSLASVSCSSAVACTAVGSFEGSSDLFSLAEAWNGTAWALETTPNAATTTGSVLDGVSCTSAAASCSAVGFFDSPAGALPLAEAWNGHVWTIQAITSPPGPAAVSQLNGVSCSSATACTAVGFFQNSASTDLTLAEGWNGTAWRIQPTPDPADAGTFPGSVLSAVSCSSAAACMAVGNYTNTAGNVVTLAESWNGTAWTIGTTLNPAGATNTALAGVFCGSATDCTAVGRSFDAAGNQTAVVESWNGAAWQSQAAAVPAGATGAELGAVSCRSASACTAVGSYNDSSGTQVTLAESWNGTAWHVQSTPDPAGATASALVGLSCRTAEACWAAGHSYDTSGTELTLAESLNGTVWKVRATPNPAGATASYIDGGSCSGPDACSAVGSYTDSSGVQLTLAESWNGTAWTVRTTPNPTGAIESQLNGVSCASGGTCTAVGYSAPSLFNQRALAEVKT